MTDLAVIDVGRKTLLAVMYLSAPMLLMSLFVGLTISIFQAATQIHEMTLTFIPKLVTLGAALLIFLPWMIQEYRSFFQEMLGQIPRILGSG
jgi:flagellar biosynthetic protein FliQ